MDQNTYGGSNSSNYSRNNHRFLPPPQLPSPSQLQLHLPPSQNNTLPPIPPIPGRRYTLPDIPHHRDQPWPPSQHSSAARDVQYSQPDQPPIKHESLPMTRTSIDDAVPAASDFVKKLYKMLEDSSIHHVVAWGPQGDCFVVKDMNDFTKIILPRMFKHSNFASFVRQLNKYDFHKIKNTDDGQFGEQSWTFRHPHFHADRREDLENIKRKVPAQRKQNNNNNNARSSEPGPPSSSQHQRTLRSSSRHHSPSSNAPSPTPPSPSYNTHALPLTTSAHYQQQTDALQTQVTTLQSQLASLQSQLASLTASNNSLSTQLRAMAESHNGLVQECTILRRERDLHLHYPSLHKAGPLSSSSSSSPLNPDDAQGMKLTSMARVLDSLQREEEAMRRRVGLLERGYEEVLREIGGVQRGMAQQDGLMQGIIGGFLGVGEGEGQQQSGGGGGVGATTSLEVLGSVDPLAAVAFGQGGPGLSAASPGPSSSSSSLSLSVAKRTETVSPPPVVYHGQQRSSQEVGENGARPGPPPPPPPPSAVAVAVTVDGVEPQRKTRGLKNTVQAQMKVGKVESEGEGELQRSGRMWDDQSRNWNRNRSQGQGQGENMMFLPLQLTADAARASLMQMSEMSRRAEKVGFMFGSGGGGGGAASAAANDGGVTAHNGGDGGGLPVCDEGGFVAAERRGGIRHMHMRVAAPVGTEEMTMMRMDRRESESESRIWAAAASAGLFGSGGEEGSSSSSSGPRVPGAGEDGSGTAWGRRGMVETHGGLQVYTVGHLMPRDEHGLGLTFGSGEEEEAARGRPFVRDEGGQWEVDGPGGVGAGGGDDRGRGRLGLGGYPFGDGEDAEPGSGSASASMGSAAVPVGGASKRGAGAKKLRVRRSTFVPGWAVPPRVLLVDDDAVSRKLGSKFLQVYGCTIDVAVDGVGAVNKMNLEKYDLVLMDIVMPKLDGVSATSLIRKFDHMTPIISMTSNSKPNEIMTYYSSGMNDILPKPFTKEGLFEMLEKHLTHLKLIQEMSRVPRSVGIPPLSDTGFEQVFIAQAALTPSGAGHDLPDGMLPMVLSQPSSATFAFYEDEGRINPLAGMGLTDDQYSTILQNMRNGQNLLDGMGMGMGMVGVDMIASERGRGREKRHLEMDDEDHDHGRDGKRSRFEVIE